MKKILSIIALAVAFSFAGRSEEIAVESCRYAGPFPVVKPFMVDTVDVNSKPFDASAWLDSPLSEEALKGAQQASFASLPASDGGASLNWAGFSFDCSGFAKATIKVEGLSCCKVLLDGEQASEDMPLAPGSHEVCIRFVREEGKAESPKVTIVSPQEGRISLRQDGKHLYGMKDVLLGTRYSGVELSPDGKFMIVHYSTTFEGGAVEKTAKIVETATGREVCTTGEHISWMPSSNKYFYTRKAGEGQDLVAVDPQSGSAETIARSVPEGDFSFVPTEDALIYSLEKEGPGEKEGIYQILTPDDRQKGWRNRSYAAIYDLKTGVMQPLSFGYHNSYVADVSRDGSKALLCVYKERLTERPTTLSDLYMLDLKTLEAEPLIQDEGFMGDAQLSPDGTKILLGGSPEAFGGIGKNVSEGLTPSMTDNQLFLMDIATRKIKPLTKKFNPSVEQHCWNRADGMIYFTAENLDCLSLYRLNPGNGKIVQMEASEDLVKRFSVASTAPVMAYYGQGAMNSDRLYTLDLKSDKATLREDLSAEILKDVDMGECLPWTFKNDNGEPVCARYYLPPHFDASKKYPMVVNYYGGCSPTSRNFESRYPHHAYASLGYVVLIIAVPSGATGNGQEWSARHVNTAGRGPAEDIITGTKKFCEEHSFVNASKIGCIGASYGGFMSEYLPTVTDIFACSISHAGISDHTSYWGIGYWGYSYSEVSMAGSYPWSSKDLFVDQSPLYRAEKINTPLLLIHGDADVNVPFTESIQLFTALKLLGKETALVAVKDQDHHILDYQKRLDWQDTIWAWFAKWLQDDPGWWDALYPPKSL